MTEMQKRMGMSEEMAEYKAKLQVIMRMLHAQEEEQLVNEIRCDYEKFKTNEQIMQFTEPRQKVTKTFHDNGTVAEVEAVFGGGKPKFKFS